MSMCVLCLCMPFEDGRGCKGVHLCENKGIHSIGDIFLP